MDPKKKFWLFKKAEHFCSVPWNHFEVFSNGNIRTCSKGQSLGNIHQLSIDKILQGQTLTTIKQDLFDNKLNVNCHGCHDLTTAGEHFDLRNHYNPMFKSFDVDYANTGAFELHGIDLHWNNTCNFKCIYCNAEQSSLIAQEQQITINKNSPENVDQIIDMVVKNQYHMNEIYLSGGEPLLIKQNYKLLKQIENKNLPLRINSNISVADDSNLVFGEVKKFTNVLWTLSAEASGERFNHIRANGNWNIFIQNLENIKQLNHKIRLNSVFFIGSLTSIFDSIEYFITTHGISDITINQLCGHKYLQARNAPVELKARTLDRLQKLLGSGLIEFKSNSYYNILRCQDELEHPIEDPKGYVRYFDNLDRLRGTDWRKIFVELVE
jgi:sulfatase maturation enzyme AslB (radical SAM superfamily)